MKKNIYFIIASIIIYFITFVMMAKTIVIGAPTVAIIPVFTIGWFFGLWPGVIAGVISFPVNALMFIACGMGFDQLLGGGRVVGTLAIILGVVIIGRMRDLTQRLNLELQERQKVEQELIKSKEEALQSKATAEKALAKVKTLGGLLPICASCKKIRDDKGYWNQIEGYIKEHTDADFSHGICPECAKELYPDHYKKINDKLHNHE